jgi:hypothetical protein
MPEMRTSRLLLAGVIVGLVVGGPAGAVLAPGPLTSPSPDNQPSGTYSASSGCYDGGQENNGWLYVAANGKTWAVSLNATILHPRDTEIEFNISQQPTDTYEIALTTNETATEQSRSSDDCRMATTVNIATGLAEPVFDISVNGRIVRSIDQDETAANLYYLPNPLNATE